MKAEEPKARLGVRGRAPPRPSRSSVTENVSLRPVYTRNWGATPRVHLVEEREAHLYALARGRIAVNLVPRPLDGRGRDGRSSRRKHDCLERRVLRKPVARVDWSGRSRSCAQAKESLGAECARRDGQKRASVRMRVQEVRVVQAAQTVTSWRDCSTPKADLKRATGGRITRPGKDGKFAPA